MPFVYSLASDHSVTQFLSANATPNTETPNMAIRQAVRGFDLQSLYAIGRGGGLTSISGIAFRVRRWTTAGTGGTAITPSPRRLGTTASTTASDSQTSITAGTVSGVYQLAFGCGAAGPGGWVAPNADSTIHVEGTSADELNVNSVSATASLNFELSGEIFE